MVDFNPLARQPSNIDYANNTQFRFDIMKLPNVQYNVIRANIPGLSFDGNAEYTTRFKRIPAMGEVVNYEDLNLTFIVQENFANYIEVHDWIIGIGFPQSTTQFANAIASGETGLKPNAGGDVSRTNTSSKVANISALESDATLTILTNKNNPTVRVNFKSLYPSALTGVEYDVQSTTTTPLTATVTFKYSIYEFETL